MLKTPRALKKYSTSIFNPTARKNFAAGPKFNSMGAWFGPKTSGHFSISRPIVNKLVRPQHTQRNSVFAFEPHVRLKNTEQIGSFCAEAKGVVEGGTGCNQMGGRKVAFFLPFPQHTRSGKRSRVCLKYGSPHWNASYINNICLIKQHRI
jgi:hypothetical protein